MTNPPYTRFDNSSLKIKRMQKDKDKKMPYVRKADIATYRDNWEKAFELKTHR